MLDYKGIIDELDSTKLKKLLYKLDIPYQETEEYLLMPTVCHHDNIEEASWKLYFYKNTHVFYCYTECGAMQIFQFLENYYEARNIEYDWFKDVYLVAQDCSNFKTEKEQHEKYKEISDLYQVKDVVRLPNYNEAVLDSFIQYYPIEWLNDGITKEAMDKFGIKYSISQNKIIIPHRDVEGRLIGIRGRALNPDEIENYAKYAPVKLEKTVYKHPLSMNLYGLYENKQNIINSGIVYIAESEKSVLQAENFSKPNCVVATCGSSLNIFQIKLLIEQCYPQHIVLCYDKEEEPGQTKYFNKLCEICKKYKKYSNISFLYDRNNLLDMKDSPFDKGENIFNELIKNRVKV